MSEDDMHTRTSRLEWEVESLKDEQRRQGDRMTELSTRIDVHHKEVMEAIGSLRDDRARTEGAVEARGRMVRWISVGIAVIGLMLALGLINTAEGSWLPVAATADAPIPVQHYTREVP